MRLGWFKILFWMVRIDFQDNSKSLMKEVTLEPCLITSSSQPVQTKQQLHN